MTDAAISGLAGIATVIATGAVGYWTVRSKTDSTVKIKQYEDDTEIRREYVHSLRNEVQRLLLVVNEREEEIKKLNSIISEVTQKLHDTAINLAKREVEFTSSLTDLHRALQEVDELKLRVGVALNPPQKQ